MTSYVAQFVTILAATVAMIASALSVIAALRASRSASKLRSMTSLQGELLEIRDYVAKLDAWAKRINAREVMQERNAAAKSSDGKQTASSTRAFSNGPVSKDELRRVAGIIPGRPAPHPENM
ncbi:MAG TPA: hypothetical protein VFC18_00490 [Burkholderiales bacterium]|nr:hypothetical protein [Burkholderiales bacterium]